MDSNGKGGMTRREELLALAERAEALGGGDYRLEQDICIATGGKLSDPPSWSVCPDYTSSIDAAMALVPEGWAASITRFTNGTGKAVVWVGDYSDAHKATDGIDGASPAIALCAAILRVLAKEQST